MLSFIVVSPPGAPRVECALRYAASLPYTSERCSSSPVQPLRSVPRSRFETAEALPSQRNVAATAMPRMEVPARKIVEHLDEVSCAPAPSAQLRDEDGSNLADSGQRRTLERSGRALSAPG